jgi:hypothetical protein
VKLNGLLALLGSELIDQIYYFRHVENSDSISTKTAPLLLWMYALNIRIENGGSDMAAETKYTLGWQGMEKTELEPHKQMPFYRIMWLQGIWLFVLRDLFVWSGYRESVNKKVKSSEAVYEI